MAGQIPVIAGGRVVRAMARDSVPASGVEVVLHRVGRAEQGPVDSAVTDRRGRFRFRFLADTASVYLVSARHSGIAYFAPPVHTNPALPDTAIELFVSDTSSSAPVTLEARHVVVSAPGEDGSRAVVEVIILRNDGPLTRVGGDSTRPVWGGRLPAEAAGFAVEEGDFGAESVSRRGDSIVVLAPVAPGEKQILVRYLLPAGLRTARYRFDAPAEMLNVMLEEKRARVRGGLRQQPDSQAIQGREFARWEGPVPAAGEITVELPAGGRVPAWLLPTMIALLAAGLLVAGSRFLGNRRPVPAEPGIDDVVDAIARLDRDHRDEPEGSIRWRAYQSERARLVQAVAAAVAARAIAG